MNRQIYMMFYFLILIPLLATQIANGQQLGDFPSKLQKLEVGGTITKASYPKLTSFFGMVNSNSKVRYLYVWIPVPTNEVGMRLVSPIGTNTPNSTDIVESGKDNLKNIFFDPSITFEIPEKPIVSATDIIKMGNSTLWRKMFSNDDSNELLAQPDGKPTNALTRAIYTKPMVHGLYRIRITAEKATQLKGSFLFQMGAISNGNGVIIAKDLSSLSKILNP